MVRFTRDRAAAAARFILRTMLFAACVLAAGAVIGIGFREDNALDPSTSSTIEDVDAAFYQFTLSADETRAFCRSHRKQIDVRETASGKLLSSLDFRGHCPIAMSHAAKEDALLATVRDTHSRECSLVLWTGSPGGCRPQLIVRDDTLAECAISPDGSVAVSGHTDGAMTVWATVGGRRLRRIAAHAGAVHRLFFSPDGRRVLSADDTTGVVWDIETGGAIARFAGPRLQFRFAAFSPDGKRIVAASADESRLRLWDVGGAAQLWEVDLKWLLTAVAYSPDGRTVVAGTGGDVSLWDVETRRCLRRFSTADGVVRCLAFSSDGKRLYAASAPGGLERWEMDDATETND
jgi:WD40 repeat protein